MIYDTLFTSALGGLTLRGQNSSKPTEEEIKKAATEFEALFINELLKHLPLSKGLGGKGLGEDVYETIFKLELSRELAQRGTGIKEMIIKAITEKYNSPSGEL